MEKVLVTEAEVSRSLNEMKSREALRLKTAGLNNTQISKSPTVGAARSTIVELFKRCELAGMDTERASEMSDTEIRAVLYPRDLCSGWLVRNCMKSTGIKRFLKAKIVRAAGKNTSVKSLTA